MTRQPHPAPVLRYLRRPLWWVLGVAAFVLLQFGAHARAVASDASAFADAAVVPAVAAPVDPDSGVIDLTYQQPSGERTAVAVYAPSFDERTVVGPVDIEVSRSDPRAVRLLTDERGYFDEMPYLLVLLLVPVASYVMRRRHISRLDALVRADQASYAMVAAVVAPGRLHPRWQLCLYPVDARPGSRPVCAVELVWLPLLPDGAFPVEVKGEPRPFGIVALRAGDELLWPRGRALGYATKHPRPNGLGPFPTEPSANGRAGSGDGAPARPSLWPARALRIAFLVALAAYLWLVQDMSWRDEQALERSQPATATVVAVGDSPSTNFELSVQYDRDGRRESATLLAQSGPPHAGEQVRIRYDVTDPGTVWEAGLSGPPDARDDMILLVLLATMLGTFVASVLTRRQALADLGAHELAVAGRVDLGTLPARPG